MGNNSYKSKYSGEQIEAMFDIVMSNTKEDKANKVTKITDGLSAEKYPSAVAVKSYVDAEINNIDDTLEQVEAVAKGRAVGYVFDTVDDMNEWLQNPDNVALLNLGDNFYIRDKNVPDYWWDKDTGTAQELETQKVDLTEYVKTEEGKGLSTNDFTDEEKNKLAEILNGIFKLVSSNGKDETIIAYDNITPTGTRFDIFLNGGELTGAAAVIADYLYYRKNGEDAPVSVDEVIDVIQTALENKIENNSLGFVLSNGSDKTYFYYDGITAQGMVFNMEMGGGVISGCTEANIEVLRYYDLDTGKWVDVQTALASKAGLPELGVILDEVIAAEKMYLLPNGDEVAY